MLDTDDEHTVHVSLVDFGSSRPTTFAGERDFEVHVITRERLQGVVNTITSLFASTPVRPGQRESLPAAFARPIRAALTAVPFPDYTWDVTVDDHEPTENGWATRVGHHYAYPLTLEDPHAAPRIVLAEQDGRWYIPSIWISEDPDESDS